MTECQEELHELYEKVSTLHNYIFKIQEERKKFSPQAACLLEVCLYECTRDGLATHTRNLKWNIKSFIVENVQPDPEQFEMLQKRFECLNEIFRKKIPELLIKIMERLGND